TLALVALCILAPYMYPLQRSSSANFWDTATGVDLGSTKQFAEYVALDRDRLVWGMQWHFEAYMDAAYQTIPLKDVESDFPAVQRELARRAALNNPDDFV